uniref:GNAT family N-acetyltransferase n=1 Tax=Faecalibacillus intestinalis TaxID=1982626 RepID=UPI00295E706B
MIKKINNKGMTLVEIVVVLLIASIIMTITGGILVNSLGYFDTTTKKSLDKQTLDGVLDFISNEITYATDVRVSNTKPDDRDWHYLYVLKNDIKNNGYVYYIIQEDDEVIAFCGIRPENDKLFISKIYVDPKYQR